MFVSQAGIPPVRPGRRGTTPPLGLEAKSLKNGTTHYWISRSRAHTNKQTILHGISIHHCRFVVFLFLFRGHPYVMSLFWVGIMTNPFLSNS